MFYSCVLNMSACRYQVFSFPDAPSKRLKFNPQRNHPAHSGSESTMTIMRVARLLSILYVLLSSLTAAADPADPFFLQNYDNRNGLSNSSINHIFRDKDNLLWVATWACYGWLPGTA
jgi:hypothetical protein